MGREANDEDADKSVRRGARTLPVPRIGEHSVEILTELGRAEQVAALIASDVVGIPAAE